MAETSNPTGLGQDGYLNYQAEVTYGTAATGSEIDLPIKSGTLLKGYPEQIENNNIIASRFKQDVNSGRIVVDGSIVMDIYPTLIGAIMNQIFGAATSAAVGDGAYTHYLYIPKTGIRIGKSITVNQAVGDDLADTFKGVIIDSFTINQDNAGNTEITLVTRGQDYTEDTARETTWSYPSSSSNPPFMFGHASITFVPAGGTQITTCANSLSITVNLNHELDRYKICSSANGAKISQPIYKSIPSVEVSMNVDADQFFMQYARSHTKFDLIVDWTHTVSEAGTTPTYHNLALEFPECLLPADTEIANENDLVSMDLSLDCSYGGTTTNSGAAEYMGEIRWTDATATYT